MQGVPYGLCVKTLDKKAHCGNHIKYVFICVT